MQQRKLTLFNSEVLLMFQWKMHWYDSSRSAFFLSTHRHFSSWRTRYVICIYSVPFELGNGLAHLFTLQPWIWTLCCVIVMCEKCFFSKSGFIIMKEKRTHIYIFPNSWMNELKRGWDGISCEQRHDNFRNRKCEWEWCRCFQKLLTSSWWPWEEKMTVKRSSISVLCIVLRFA